ncbi:MAG TPA: hypothetical protein VIT00_13765, partial [Terrimicrobiaceae bacterium]
QRKLQQATNDIETVGTKARSMQRKLREVESVSVEDSNAVFGITNEEVHEPELQEDRNESNGRGVPLIE